MKAKKMTFGGLCSIFLIVALLISCNKNPSPPGETNPANNGVVQPPIKAIGTLLGIPSILEKLHIIYVPGHYFDFGSSNDDPLSRGDEKPQTRVKMPGFFMFGDEVTNGEYAVCEESGVCTPPQTSDQGPCTNYRNTAFADIPVVCVNWFQANTFCQWVEGKLPSEAQWEKAARGINGNIYPWGDSKPTCDLLNMAGCGNEAGPVKIGSYPKGASPYGILDMAGNVREWIEDWYQPNYQNIALYNPSGPAEGKFKLVRGGGWNDFAENLRTTARAAYPPETTHEDVGFRCVPTSTEYAPFCPSRYVNLCTKPNIPTGETPCTPETQQSGGGQATISNFGCPNDGNVTITFDSNGGGNAGFTANVNGQGFPCTPATGADLIRCTGPAPKMGSKASITICGGGETPSATTNASVAQTSSGGIILASLAKNDPLNVLQTAVHYCPDGYIWQAATNTVYTGASGECIRNPNADCPQGWFVSTLLNCQPTNDQSCPPGTKMNRDAGGCVPDKNCPDGYVLTDKKTCEPEQNDRKLCPAGYYFNKTAQCCQPIRGNNYNCDANHYFDPNYKRCMPMDGNGCGFNSVFDGYNRCLGIPYNDPQTPGEGQCPGNLAFVAANTCNTPPNGYNDDKPDPLRIVRTGDTLLANSLVNTDTGSNNSNNCGQGAAFVAAFNNCVNRDGNQCPYGYYFSENLKRCIPDNGPGSGCPQGTTYQPRLGCCVPTPGYDGSRCPQDKQTATVVGVDSDPLKIFAVTVYDPQQDACDPGTTQDGQTPQCPPGYPTTNNQPCTFNQGTALFMMNANGNQPPTYDAINCPPGYWDQQKQTCNYQPPQCGANEYFDYYLGFCVHLQPNCCQLGQSFSALLKRCAPDEYLGEPPKDGKTCPDGYEMVNGQCLLIGRSQGGQCWTFSVTVPTCVGPCRVGTTYNPVTGQCEKPQQNACASVVCSVKYCPSNCCTRLPGGKCVHK